MSLVLGSSLAAVAQSTPPAPAPSADPGIVPGSLSGAQRPPGTPTPAPAGLLAVPTPTPLASIAPVPAGPPPPGHFRLSRPGTSLEGDALYGNTQSGVFVAKGNAVLQSDPSVDRAAAKATESHDPLTVTADEIDVDRVGLTYVAKGHVHFVQGTRHGTADLALLNDQTHDVDLLGHADVADGERRARADKMHYNSVSRAFHGAGDVRLYEPLPSPKPAASGTPGPKRKRRGPLPI